MEPIFATIWTDTGVFYEREILEQNTGGIVFQNDEDHTAIFIPWHKVERMTMPLEAYIKHQIDLRR